MEMILNEKITTDIITYNSFIPGSISANTPAPTGVSILEINGFQNIVNTGDRFYLVYYDLDLSTWCNTNVLAVMMMVALIVHHFQNIQKLKQEI